MPSSCCRKSRIVKWTTWSLVITGIGCSVYDDELASPRDASVADARPNDDASLDGVNRPDASEDPGVSGGAGGSSGRGGSGGSGASAGSGAVGGSRGDAAVDSVADRVADGMDAMGSDAKLDPGVDGGDATPGHDVTLTDASDATVFDAPADTGGPVVGLPYNIVAKHSGKCVTVLANLPLDGTEIVQVACSNADSQRFRLQSSASGAFTVVSDSWSKCATVDISDSATSRHVQLVTCDGSPSQHYAVIPSSTPGWFTLSTGPNQCLEVDGASPADLTNVMSGNCSSGANQIWQFVPAPRDP